MRNGWIVKAVVVAVLNGAAFIGGIEWEHHRLLFTDMTPVSVGHKISYGGITQQEWDTATESRLWRLENPEEAHRQVIRRLRRQESKRRIDAIMFGSTK